MLVKVELINMKIVLAIILLVIVVGIIYYINPVIFRDTPRALDITVDLGTTHKGAYGKYSEIVLIDGSSVMIEKNDNGEDIIKRIYSSTSSVAKFNVKVSNYCDIRHGCFDVVEAILKNN